MPVAERLSSFFANLRSRIRSSDDADADPAAPEPQTDTAEEFAKIQRGMRRLSLASDRSGELLQAVAGRLDEVKQTLLTLNRPQQAALSLDEPQLLNILDQLDRLTNIPDVPSATGPLVHEIKAALLSRARWLTVALVGNAPSGADIRIAEFVGEPQTDVKIHQILEQGYRRADGTLLRPAVVIAGAATQAHHSPSNATLHLLKDAST